MGLGGNGRRDPAARTPKALVVWFALIDLLVAAALVFVGIRVDGPASAVAWLFAALFAVIACLHLWRGLGRR